MMTDWTRDAAEEIARVTYEMHPHHLSAANIAAIIRKHCPFRQDVAYCEVTAPVDYRHNDGVD